MSAPKLVLHPADAAATPDPLTLLQVLEALRLIGPAFQLDALSHFRAGPAFLEHISFLGCSPAIELDPPPENPEESARAGAFCHLQLHTATALPRLRLKTDLWPRCRACRADIDPAPLRQSTSAMTLTCPGCGQRSSTARLNWRQSGGFARIFLDIWGIHSAEAVPGDLLLDQLGKTTGGRWDFFYIED